MGWGKRRNSEHTEQIFEARYVDRVVAYSSSKDLHERKFKSECNGYL